MCKNTTSAQNGQNRLTEATCAKTQRQSPSRHVQKHNVSIYLPYIHHFRLLTMDYNRVFILSSMTF